MVQPVGHFRIWRALYTKPIWLKSTLEQQVILMTLMAMANFKSNEWEWKGEKCTVKAGQFITSLESIRVSTGSNVSIQNIRTALRRFEKLEFLTNESTKEGRLITLVNWLDYQYNEDDPNIATNKDLTKTSQRPNKDLTPREEGKKDNNEKKDNIELLETIETDKEYQRETPHKILFEELWNLYPKKKGKSGVKEATMKKLHKLGSIKLKEAIENYKKEIEAEKKEPQFIMNGSTFFNGRYTDYLQENIPEPKKVDLSLKKNDMSKWE